MFCFAEGFWKAEEMYKFYIVGVHRPQIFLTFHNEILRCFHATFQQQILLHRVIHVTLPLFFFFFLVLCLPRQVRTSNGAIQHDPQLSPSTCCNPLSASSPVTSFLIFLFSFSLPFFPRL